MRTSYLIGAVVACVIALLLGYVLGFRSAWQLGVQAEFAARGVLATQMHQSMQSGKTELVTTLIESDIDNALLFGGEFVESPLRPVLPLIGVDLSADYEQFLRRTAKYRKSHPSTMSSRDPAMNAILVERIERYAK
jgi:hypothetical protein